MLKILNLNRRNFKVHTIIYFILFISLFNLLLTLLLGLLKALLYYPRFYHLITFDFHCLHQRSFKLLIFTPSFPSSPPPLIFISGQFYLAPSSL